MRLAPRLRLHAPALALTFVVVSGSACTRGTEVAAPQSERLETGRACAPATASCEPGRCVATIDNQCDLPVTCRMSIESQCDAGGVSGPANAATKQVTQLAKTSNVLEASTQCSQGAPVLTKVVALECI
jgi:hypothetical protein